MGLYEISAKRAERLLRKNWASATTEAHRLGGLNLPGLSVEVGEGAIVLRLHPETLMQGLYSRIGSDGSIYSEVLVQWQDGHWEGDDAMEGFKGLTLLLKEALREAQNRASRMGEVKEELAKIR